MKKLQELKYFINSKMTMRDNYQPVIIKHLLKNGGIASKRDLAIALLKNDEIRVKQYEKILMRWPKTTLEKHGIVKYDKKEKKFKLKIQIEKEDENVVLEMLNALDMKINEWEKTISSVASSNRYLALADAHGKCQLCGIPSSLRPLHVDHIVPKSTVDKNGFVVKDGVKIPVDDLENLQVLCSSCNLGKSSSDQRDFRSNKSKLVRDNIINEIIADGRKPDFIILDDTRFKRELQKKLLEEYVEYINAKNDNETIYELVDIYEVILAILKTKSVLEDEFIKMVKEKRELKGAFEKKMFLKN